MLQMDIAFGQPEKNRDKVRELVNQLASAEQKPDVILLPELWDTGYDLQRLDEIADDNGTLAKQVLSEAARQLQCYVVGGSIAERLDIRFPEWLRTYALTGTKLMFVCAQWPHPQLNHWRQLLIARAVENQMYVVACNRVGDGGKSTNGKNVRYHFQGAHGKVVQMRELVEVLDQMFDSFEKVNQLSRTMLGQPKDITQKIERLR